MNFTGIVSKYYCWLQHLFDQTVPMLKIGHCITLNVGEQS